MITKTIEISLDTFDPEILKAPKEKIAVAMEAEVAGLNRELQLHKMQPMNVFERAIIKTYLAWKLGLGIKAE